MAARTRKTAAPSSPQPPADEITIELDAATEADVPVKRTRQSDPLLTAKRRVEQAQKRTDRAEAKWAKVSGLEEELAAARDELDAAKAEFQDLIKQYL